MYSFVSWVSVKLERGGCRVDKLKNSFSGVQPAKNISNGVCLRNNSTF